MGEFVAWLSKVDWNAVAADIQAIATKANAVADALGGWERVGEGVVAFIAGSWFLRMAAPFATLGIAAAELTFAVGKTLVLGFVAAGDAAVAFEGKAAAALATAQSGLGLGAKMGLAGLLTHVALSVVDPHDSIGSWIDRNVWRAGAAGDFVARHTGGLVGRTYQ